MNRMIYTMTGCAAMLASAAAFAQRGPQGPVTRDAYVAMQKERFAAMDANGDGVVTRDEMTARITERMGEAPPPERIDALFKQIDADGDGKATAAEAEAAAIARFNALDADHDGTLTPDERRAGMRDRMGGGRP